MEDPQAGVLRRGSYYAPQRSIRYFPQAYKRAGRGRLLMIVVSIHHSGAAGFRFVQDAQ